MKYIQGQNRSQTYLFPVSLDDAISEDNEVRLIDVFVNSLALESYGFKIEHTENGRPAYHPGDLLKLFIYGYMNKIRSSRRLEKESKRNIEVMWLLGNLHPDHNTISNFRRDNPRAIRKVFMETVKIANYFNLIGGALIAGDSTKFRAQNSKKNNFNQKKISRHLEYIENKLQEYNEALAQSDGDDKKHIEDQIEKHKQRADGYHEIENQLRECGESQVSTSDPDSRQMSIQSKDTIQVNIAYSQHTEKENVYVMESTQTWGQPLAQADYSLIVDESVQIDSLSMESDSLINNVFYWTKQNFFPIDNFKIWIK